MAETNVRGTVRKKPDPMAIATRGRVTTYEALAVRNNAISGKTQPKVKARLR